MVDFIKDLSELPSKDDRQMSADWAVAEITSFDVESDRTHSIEKPLPRVIARAEDGALLIIDDFEWDEVGQIMLKVGTLTLHGLLALKVVYNRRDPNYFVGVLCA